MFTLAHKSRKIVVEENQGLSAKTTVFPAPKQKTAARQCKKLSLFGSDVV
jgi:hypothetical protein